MIKAGLIGETLGHSMSPEIHQKFYEKASLLGSYELFETPRSGLAALLDDLENRGFIGLNVTIPYKTEVMQYLDEISPEAQEIGAVNTIAFSRGKRYGHNTDYYGLKTLLDTNDVQVNGNRVVILGTGGVAKCAHKLAADMGAGETIVVSRNPGNANAKLHAVSYDTLEALGGIDVLINTTPVGMSPNAGACPVSDIVIEKSAQVVDLIYNPLQTVLLSKADALGKLAVNGLLMLVGQAIKAQEIWTGQVYEQKIYDGVYDFMHKMMRGDNENIVLIGMPGCGKSSIGRLLAQQLNMEFIDTDSLIEGQHGGIPQIFESQGERIFRDYEWTAAKIASQQKNAVISTGGGIILDERNMTALRQTGRIIYIDRPLKALLNDIETEGRPLLKNGKSALIALHHQRDSLYRKYADMIADNTGDIAGCIAEIIRKLEDSKHEITRD